MAAALVAAGQKVVGDGDMIYFIQTADNQFIKIGRASDPLRRMTELQVSTPYTLKLLAAMPGHSDEEAAIHRQFHHYAVRGEWFKAKYDLVLYAAQHGIQTTAFEYSNDWHIQVFADLTLEEPRLLELYATAASTCDDHSGRSFCANAVWFGNFGWHGIKPELLQLVGWCAKGASQNLRTSDAYEAAYRTIYETLPGCRNCHCE